MTAKHSAADVTCVVNVAPAWDAIRRQVLRLQVMLGSMGRMCALLFEAPSGYDDYELGNTASDRFGEHTAVSASLFRGFMSTKACYHVPSLLLNKAVRSL